MKPRVKLWLAASTISTLMFGTAYGLVQQSWRMSANLPLIPLAETAAYQVEQGTAPAATVGHVVNPVATHQPFVIVYSRTGSVLASSGRINGAAPQLPPGIFNNVHIWQQDRFTWQMASGLRFATVVTAISNGTTITGYALAAQHIDYVENEEAAAARIALLGWALSLMVLTTAVL